MSIHTDLQKSVRWAFNIRTWQPTEPEFLLASACVQEEEKVRIGKFLFQNDVKASLIGRLLMRKYVSSACGIPYSEVKLLRDDKGKPYVLNLDVNFNVSHHGDLVVLAGEVASKKVGVDVMKFDYKNKTEIELEEFFRIMSRQFTPQEWKTIRGPVGTPIYKQVVMFYRHWCLKESYLKAIGTGITTDLNRIGMVIQEWDLCVDAVIQSTRVFFDKELLKGWSFEETLLDDHCVSVAVRCELDKLESERGLYSPSVFQFLDFDQLMLGSSPLLESDMKYVCDFFEKTEKIT